MGEATLVLGIKTDKDYSKIFLILSQNLYTMKFLNTFILTNYQLPKG